jgi:hypothetical protein
MRAVDRHPPGMSKRTVATSLWFLTGWALGSMLSAMAGWPSLVGPVLAIVLAGVVWWDPRHVIWFRQDDI